MSTTTDATPAPLRAYHNDPALRARTIAEMEAHAEAEVVAYFGRAAYRVALASSEKSSRCPLTVGHARPTVCP